MNKIYVLGYTGMLGRYVFCYLKKQGFNAVGLNRSHIDAESVSESNIDLFLPFIAKEDIVINCIGMIKPQVDKLGTFSALKVNSMFPHVLNEFCKERESRFIHITTDCVFSGSDGNYSEKSLHDCTDVYGKTKSLGEVTQYGTVVRTSIIGEEIGTTRSLIEWIKSMAGKTANGFTNHWWNGLTCLQVAKVFETMITNDLYWEGIRHIPSPNKVNKFELLQMVSNTYDLGLNINPVEASMFCDRTMVSLNDNSIFDIPSLDVQIKEQKEFFPYLNEL